MTESTSFNCMRQTIKNLSRTLPIVELCNHIPKLLSVKDVVRYTNLSRSIIYEITNEKSGRYDPIFHKKI